MVKGLVRPMEREMAEEFDRTAFAAQEELIRSATHLRQELRRTAVQLVHGAFPTRWLRRFGL